MGLTCRLGQDRIGATVVIVRTAIPRSADSDSAVCVDGPDGAAAAAGQIFAASMSSTA